MLPLCKAFWMKPLYLSSWCSKREEMTVIVWHCPELYCCWCYRCPITHGGDRCQHQQAIYPYTEEPPREGRTVASGPPNTRSLLMIFEHGMPSCVSSYIVLLLTDSIYTTCKMTASPSCFSMLILSWSPHLVRCKLMFFQIDWLVKQAICCLVFCLAEGLHPF